MPLPDDDFDVGAELARFKAEMEQARESIREVALAQRAYYEALVESGFTPEEALDLTRTWLGAALGGGSE
jgi:hypothetical protein